MHSSKRIDKLREELNVLRTVGTRLEVLTRVDYVVSNSGIHVFYFGPFDDDTFQTFARAITTEEVATDLLALTLDGPDEGANGTRNLDLSYLIDERASYPELRHFEVKRGRPGDHNQTVVAEIYEEDGQIGRLVRKTPKLGTLVVPSAPGANFFECELSGLRNLDIDAGYDTQNFIERLAGSSILKNLSVFAWGEYSQTYMEDWMNYVTPYDSMERLFRSAVFEDLSRFVLRNPIYSEDELHRLSAFRPNLQFMAVCETGRYVSDR